VRWLKRRRLLEEPAKPVGGYRNYPKEIVKRIRFIKRAQALGFSLEEVAELLQLDVADACAKSCDLADRKLAVIDQKIAELAAMRGALAKLMALCEKVKARRMSHHQGSPAGTSVALIIWERHSCIKISQSHSFPKKMCRVL